AYLVLDKTPFYATSGGQLHDKGYLLQSGNMIEIIDVFKDKNNNHIHKVKGLINDSDDVEAAVDFQNRIGLMRNHSSTHLLFAALREVYGNKIVQLGSDITAERFTFDFPLDKKPTEIDLKLIEDKINKIIEKNIEREYIITTISEAKKIGATMTVEEMRYLNHEDVRVVKFGNVTTDLCGGTHIDYTKNIEKIKIISVDTKGSGIYRIRAITSNNLIEKYMHIEIDKYILILQSLIKKINELSNVNREYSLKNENNLEKYLEDTKKEISKNKDQIKELLKSSNKISIEVDLEEVNVNGIKLFFSNVVKKSMIKNIAITTRQKYPDAIIVLLSEFLNDSLLIITSQNNDIQKLVNNLTLTCKIKGGGNANMWQGMSFNTIDLEEVKKNL
ncbi:MAG: alanine--tRNA ligase, partial [Mycoplasmataceae bacterium]|nr:alanine--tRNA ligase [Mycoplasmataceae bacterium]